MDIASRLKEARELKGATQTQVSKETGINNKTLSIVLTNSFYLFF